MKMSHQVDSTPLPKEEPEDDVTNLEHAELVLNSDDIKEEQDELGHVGQLVFEPIPEYWEELDSPGPRPITSQLETPTSENQTVLDSFPGFSTTNILTISPLENTGVPDKNEKPAEELLLQPVSGILGDSHTQGSHLETASDKTSGVASSYRESGNKLGDLSPETQPPRIEKVPQSEDTRSKREAQSELTVSMPSYISPMTSPIDVLTPINITYSRGVPPPTIVQYEEGEEKKDVIKLDEDEDKCYHYHRFIFFGFVMLFRQLF